ncbi:MAG: hypothetical protein RL158_1039 [Bacteroidota bacterium]
MSAHTTFTNALIHEQSPYLLQHAHNPVNWIAWSSSIFELAQTQNKPILLSIGYAACHWCHVMERESFEDEEVARYMNAHFINVKVDREERPDVDQIYMDALQAMTGSGGWPLNIFLLPNGKPFYGGTYFPPKTLSQRASWMDVLKGVHEAFQTNQEKLIEQANNLTTHLVQTNIKEKIDFDSTTTYPSIEEFDLMTKRILQNADTQWGGFGVAPKFPQTFSIQVLLRNYFANQDQSAIVHAVRSLDKMIQGGLYDHLGGGFARYSTDAQWQAPHFEKMLYDNALLIGVLSEAYQLTKKSVYKNVIQETIHFVFRELSDTNGMFYAALDADSEGVEGKYYTWSYEELQQILPENLFKPFCQYFQIKEAGNWEHTNIIWTINLIEEAWNDDLLAAKKILFTHREKRIRPGTDTKILLSWNCLMIIALSKAYAITEDKSLLERAEKNMQWLSIHMQSKEGYLFHSFTNGHLKSMAFLEDYASMMQALIELHKATGNKSYLNNAKRWMEYVQLHFIDEQKVFFYFTSDEQLDGIIRKKDSYDGATPSSNAMVCSSLIYLGSIFDEPIWIEQAHKMLASMHSMMIQYPSSFGYWAQSFFQLAYGLTELVGIGPNVDKNLYPILKQFLPHILPLWMSSEDSNFPTTFGKQGAGNQYFICKNKTCSPPYEEIEGILAKI